MTISHERAKQLLSETSSYFTSKEIRSEDAATGKVRWLSESMTIEEYDTIMAVWEKRGHGSFNDTLRYLASKP